KHDHHHKKKGFYKFDEEEKPKPSVMVTLKQQGKPLALAVLGLVVAVVVVYWVANSMMGPGRSLPPLGRIGGEVTLDGKPLPNATVTFTPDTGIDRTKRVSSSMAVTDAKGHFTMNYVEGVPGAVVGKHRVTIHAVDEKGYEQVDGSFNALENQQVVEVKAGSNPPLSFKVPRAPAPTPAVE
ncbi:MAG TPA: carboxypeptidase-like regulatory domain-containing protein, partial [Planctomycetaceae bacterium]|nr:carboxypeptidase-like regulatory domain-containing protein [Planctomycetaceae bacterium]